MNNELPPYMLYGMVFVLILLQPVLVVANNPQAVWLYCTVARLCNAY